MKEKTMSDQREITLRVKAFSNEGPKLNRIHIDDDGTIRVYDSVAGHYTIHHSLSRSAIQKIRKLAAKRSS
jgi:hypothetical protein